MEYLGQNLTESCGLRLFLAECAFRSVHRALTRHELWRRLVVMAVEGHIRLG